MVEAEPPKCFIIRKRLIITAWSQAVSSLTQLPCVGWRPPAMCLYACACMCVCVSASLREVRLKLRRIADALPHTAYTPAGCSVKILLVTIKEARTCASHHEKNNADPLNSPVSSSISVKPNDENSCAFCSSSTDEDFTDLPKAILI